MKLIDSHCHLDMEPLATEKEAAIERAYKAGVAGMINVGSSLRGTRRSVELAESYPNIWASVGLHPHDASTVLDIESVTEELRALAGSEKVVAVGEIGLDYFSPEKPLTSEEITAQKGLFAAQLELARELELPVIFHVRDAWEDFFEIVGKHGIKEGVVHCYTGDEKVVGKILDLGLYVGFTGFVTFDQAKFDHIREAACEVPLGKILVETDAPFLAPEPYRGKTNEPAYVVEVAKKIAELKNTTPDEVADVTVRNTETLFGIKI